MVQNFEMYRRIAKGFVLIFFVSVALHVISLMNRVSTKLELPNNNCHSIRNLDSSWFKQLMKNVGNPFWSENNLYVHKKSYDWWMTIQPRKRDDLSNAMRNLFKLGVKSDRRNLGEIETECISCAVVGSSDNLLETEYGKLIDSHNYVIRFNGAITKGFEKYVGYKTTHQIMYPESAPEYLDANISFVLIPFKPTDLRWLAYALEGRMYLFKSYQKPPRKFNCSIPKIAIIHPSFIRALGIICVINQEQNILQHLYNRSSYELFTKPKGRYPSTGFIGLMLALQQCDKVNLFGFGANSQGKWMHYYGPKTFSGSHYEHDDHDEKEMMKRLDDEGVIRIFRPERNA